MGRIFTFEENKMISLINKLKAGAVVVPLFISQPLDQICQNNNTNPLPGVSTGRFYTGYACVEYNKFGEKIFRYRVIVTTNQGVTVYIREHGQPLKKKIVGNIHLNPNGKIIYKILSDSQITEQDMNIIIYALEKTTNHIRTLPSN